MTGAEWLWAPGKGANWELRPNTREGLKLRYVLLSDRSERESVFGEFGGRGGVATTPQSLRILSRAVVESV